jgi:predicted MFS family arabinose efflux permease
LGIAVRDILLTVIAFNFTNVIVAWPVGALSDQVGRRGLIAVAWSIYAVTYLGLALASPGVPSGRPVGALRRVVRRERRGRQGAGCRCRAAGAARDRVRDPQHGHGLVLPPASILAGLLWDGVGPHAPFWFGAACAAAAVVLLGFIHRRSSAG